MATPAASSRARTAAAIPRAPGVSPWTQTDSTSKGTCSPVVAVTELVLD